jgi:hypothetical protein
LEGFRAPFCFCRPVVVAVDAPIEEEGISIEEKKVFKEA